MSRVQRNEDTQDAAPPRHAPWSAATCCRRHVIELLHFPPYPILTSGPHTGRWLIQRAEERKQEEATSSRYDNAGLRLGKLPHSSSSPPSPPYLGTQSGETSPTTTIYIIYILVVLHKTKTGSLYVHSSKYTYVHKL